MVLLNGIFRELPELGSGKVYNKQFYGGAATV